MTKKKKKTRLAKRGGRKTEKKRGKAGRGKAWRARGSREREGKRKHQGCLS